MSYRAQARVLCCYGDDGRWLPLIKGALKTTTWRRWCKGTRDMWQAHISSGGAAWLGKMGDAGRFGRLQVATFEFPRTLESMTNAEAVADGAPPGTTARQWQASNRKYFEPGFEYCKLTFSYVGP